MNEAILLLPIVVPVAIGLLVLAIRRHCGGAREGLTLLVTLANLALAIYLFGQEMMFTHAWAGYGLELSLRLYHFSSFILAAAAGFSFLVALYSTKFMADREKLNQFYAYLLITVGLTNGAVLANNLVALLFFWEGLLGTLFGMIYIGRPGAWKTATKAFIIVGVTDLCLMAGIALAGSMAGTLTLTEIAAKPLSLDGLGALAFVLLVIGAISKAGSMPFHSWIPDAAVDAPLPFMAFLPASLEKLLGIYFLSRITLDMFALTPGSWLSHPAGRGHGPGAEGLQAAPVVPRHQSGRLHGAGHRHGGAGRHRRRPVPHDQPRHVQVMPFPDGRRGGEAGRHD